MRSNRVDYLRGVVLAAASVAIFTGSFMCATTWAQAPTATSPTSQRGTVKAVAGSSLTIATDAGQQVTVAVTDKARIVQVAPGSTDLKSAQAITLTDIGVGDKVLVTGKAGDAADSFNASRVILMKSGDIAERHAAEQADWQKRGTGGIVSTADTGAGVLTISSGAKKIKVDATAKTIFRRYAGDSIKFEDAKPGTIAQVQVGDQLEVRGAKSEDGTSIEAEEIVTGTFRNLSGTLATISAATGIVTLKDLTTKKLMTVTVTTNSDLRKLPPEVAARFAARERETPAGSTGAGSAVARPTAASPTPASPEGGVGGGAGRAAGMDLSKMLARLPSATVADLHVGDAVMIVASESQPGSETATAVTLLSGVEAILAATPAGSKAITLSPWQVGGGAPEGGGGPQ